MISYKCFGFNYTNKKINDYSIILVSHNNDDGYVFIGPHKNGVSVIGHMYFGTLEYVLEDCKGFKIKYIYKDKDG